jgi:hypothetical protein
MQSLKAQPQPQSLASNIAPVIPFNEFEDIFNLKGTLLENSQTLFNRGKHFFKKASQEYFDYFEAVADFKLKFENEGHHFSDWQNHYFTGYKNEFRHGLAVVTLVENHASCKESILEKGWSASALYQLSRLPDQVIARNILQSNAKYTEQALKELCKEAKGKSRRYGEGTWVEVTNSRDSEGSEQFDTSVIRMYGQITNIQEEEGKHRVYTIEVRYHTDEGEVENRTLDCYVSDFKALPLQQQPEQPLDDIMIKMILTSFSLETRDPQLYEQLDGVESCQSFFDGESLTVAELVNYLVCKGFRRTSSAMGKAKKLGGRGAGAAPMSVADANEVQVLSIEQHKTINDLKGDIDAIRKERDAIQAIANATTEENENLNKKIQELESLGQQPSDTSSEVAQLRAENERLSQHLESFEKVYDEATEQISIQPDPEQEELIKEQQREIRDLKKELESKEVVRVSSEQIDKMQEVIESLNSEVERINKTLEEKEEVIKKQQKEIDDFVKQVGRVKDGANKASDSEIAEVRERVKAEFAGQIESLSQEVKKFKVELQKQEQEATLLKEQNAVLQRAVEELPMRKVKRYSVLAAERWDTLAIGQVVRVTHLRQGQPMAAREATVLAVTIEPKNGKYCSLRVSSLDPKQPNGEIIACYTAIGQELARTKQIEILDEIVEEVDPTTEVIKKKAHKSVEQLMQFEDRIDHLSKALGDSREELEMTMAKMELQETSFDEKLKAASLAFAKEEQKYKEVLGHLVDTPESLEVGDPVVPIQGYYREVTGTVVKVVESQDNVVTYDVDFRKDKNAPHDVHNFPLHFLTRGGF